MQARTLPVNNAITIAGTTGIMTDTIIVPIFMKKPMVMVTAVAVAEFMEEDTNNYFFYEHIL
jgi:hypothetical protein